MKPYRFLCERAWARLLGLVLGVVAVASGGAAEESRVPWQTDYAAALAQARAENKPLLIKFTGSDWCRPCQRLAAEVFETAEMEAFASTEVIPVYLDFPRRKELPPELAAQNQRLAERYGVRSYPTVLVVGADEEVRGKLGYVEGGPKTFIRSVRRLMR